MNRPRPGKRVRSSPGARPPGVGARRDAPSGIATDARPYLLAGLPLLAAALAGSVDRPGQGGLLAVLGLCLLWRPPAVGTLGRPLAGVALALVTWGTLPLLLPAAWLPGAAWRTALTEDLGIALGPTLSPQPWLTAEALVLLCAGLVWLWWAAESARGLSNQGRRVAGRWFVLGAAALAVTALVCQRLGVQPPGWRQERGLGPFPNRNQFGNFLALAALLALGGAHADVRAGRRWWAGVQGLALVALAVGVFGNYSRAGVVMLFGGTAVYAATSALGSRREHPPSSPAFLPGFAVAVSVLALLLAGFFLVGGDTLARFTGGGVRDAAGAVAGDFRWKIQADAFGMMRAMPPCGPGLGNFGALFPFFRDQTATTSARAVHPESDWCWLGTEMGWPALALAGFGAAALFWQLRAPPGPGPGLTLRRAALVALGAFALHSFMEVSTHRLGTMFPAALLYALAWSRGKMPPVREGIRWPFRALGAGLTVVGGLWLHAAWTGSAFPPGKLAADNLRRAGNTALRARDPAGAVALLSRAAAMVPLEWATRLDLATALLSAGRPDDARADFRRARELEPLNPRVPANEAFLWLNEGHHPEAALAAIEETFRRGPALGARLYGEAVSQHGQDPSLRPGLETLARREPALEVAFLENAPPAEVWPWLDEILAADPELTRHAGDPARLRSFLHQWARHGDPTEMNTAMNRHPAWQPVGWREWGEALVNAGDALAGCRVLDRFARPPELPTPLLRVEEHAPPVSAAEFARTPQDFALGLRLFRTQRDSGSWEDALRTLETLGKFPAAPVYLDYLEARMRMDLRDGPGAWEAWMRYLKKTGQG